MTHPEDIIQAAREASIEFSKWLLDSDRTTVDEGLEDIIAKAIAAERAKRQWQPIETAPKDGTHILIKPVRPFNPICEAFWVDDDGGYWSDGFASCIDADVSHWMPLPQPPQEASK